MNSLCWSRVRFIDDEKKERVTYSFDEMSGRLLLDSYEEWNSTSKAWMDIPLPLLLRNNADKIRELFSTIKEHNQNRLEFNNKECA